MNIASRYPIFLLVSLQTNYQPVLSRFKIPKVILKSVIIIDSCLPKASKRNKCKKRRIAIRAHESIDLIYSSLKVIFFQFCMLQVALFESFFQEICHKLKIALNPFFPEHQTELREPLDSATKS
jgi:hypothetical protein